MISEYSNSHASFSVRDGESVVRAMSPADDGLVMKREHICRLSLY